MAYNLPASIPWAAIALPLATAEDSLARLDERIRTSPIAVGWISRTHFSEACAALWCAGELVHLEDLVLHDAGMDIRTPTHELTRAHTILRTRRRILAAAPDWAVSPPGLAVLVGTPDHQVGGQETTVEAFGGTKRSSFTAGLDDGEVNSFDDALIERSDVLSSELAALDAALSRTRNRVDGVGSDEPYARDPLIYDADWNEADRLQAWRNCVAETDALPPVLAAALSWEAWRELEPLQHLPWLGSQLVAAIFRARTKTTAHLLCLNVGLRLTAQDRRRAHDRTDCLNAFCDAVSAAVAAGLKDHDRWLLARRSLEHKLVGRRSTSHLAALIDFVLARPIVNCAMIAKEIGVTPRAAQNLVAQLGLRETTGRGRYRAWGVL